MPNESSNPVFPILIFLQNEDSAERFIHIQKPEDLPLNRAFVVIAHNICPKCEEMARMAYGMGVSNGKVQQLARKG